MINTGPWPHMGQPAVQVLEDLAQLAGVALTDTPLGVPAEVGLWHDMPVEDCCDGLYLWVREWVPVVGAGGFPNAAMDVDICKPVVFCPRVVVSLRRPCMPEPDEDGNVSHEDEAATAAGLIVDMQALFCEVPALWSARLNDTFPNKPRLYYSSATPVGAGTNCSGYDWPILIEFPTCRAGCG